ARTENTRPATGARPLGAPARTLDSCHAELCSSSVQAGPINERSRYPEARSGRACRAPPRGRAPGDAGHRPSFSWPGRAGSHPSPGAAHAERLGRALAALPTPGDGADRLDAALGEVDGQRAAPAAVPAAPG